jgi:uncharacterized protein YjdB
MASLRPSPVVCSRPSSGTYSSNFDQTNSVALTVHTFLSGPVEVTGHLVTWTSSNTSVATVDDTGLVSFVGGGSVTITASCDEAISNNATFTVTPRSPAAVITSPASPGTLNVGDSVLITALTRRHGYATTTESLQVDYGLVPGTGIVSITQINDTDAVVTALGSGTFDVSVQSVPEVASGAFFGTVI